MPAEIHSRTTAPSSVPRTDGLGTPREPDVASPRGPSQAPVHALTGAPPRMSSNDSGASRPRIELPAHKKQIYVPTSGSRARLNGEVEIDGEKVWCRHFALMLSETPDDVRRSEAIKAFATPESIRAEVAHHGSLDAIENIFASKRAVGPELNQLVGNERFGEALEELAIQLAAQSATSGGKAKASLMVINSGHAMEVQLQCKLRDPKLAATADNTYFAVSFYDPEQTAQHQRVLSEDAKGLRSLKGSDFLAALGSEGHLRVHVAQGNICFEQGGQFIDAQADEGKLLASLTSAAYVESDFKHLVDAATAHSTSTTPPAELFDLLKWGSHKTFRHEESISLPDTLSMEGNGRSLPDYGRLLAHHRSHLGTREALDLLMNYHLADGSDALMRAVKAEDGDLVHFLGVAHKAFAPNESEKFTLLQSYEAAVDHAMREGCELQVLPVLLARLQDLQPSPAQSLFTLLGKDPDQSPLHAAAGAGRDGHVIAYLDHIQALDLSRSKPSDGATETPAPDDLSDEERQQIICSALGFGDPESGNKSAVQLALEAGHPGAARAICERLTSCGLTPGMAAAVLDETLQQMHLARSHPDGTDSVRRVQQEMVLLDGMAHGGELDSTRAAIKSLMANEPDPTERAVLLLGRDEQTGSLLHLAAGAGRSEHVAVYLDTVADVLGALESDKSIDAQERSDIARMLLGDSMADDVSDASGPSLSSAIELARQNGHQEIAAQIEDARRKFGLPD